MTLSEIKNKLELLKSVSFKLPNGNFVPKHFHVTEIGTNLKNFIDCGGVKRKEENIVFQLWEAEDYDHRLAPKKLLDIITLSEKELGIPDFEVEVEYQSETIGRFGLEFDGENFVLINKQTDCLAKDKCGIIDDHINKKDNNCAPGAGCC